MSIIALILGIIGLLLSCILIGIIPCSISLALSIISLKNQKPHKDMAIIGLVTSAVGILIFVLMMVLVIKNVDMADRTENEIASTEIESVNNEYKNNSTAELKKEEIESEEVKQTSEEISTENLPEGVEESLEETQIQTEPENMELETNEGISSNEKLLNDLRLILSEDIADKAYDILINQIGFTNVEYIGKNSFGDSNYDFSSDKYDFTMTASDDVYRVFQPSGGFVFYEDGEVKNSVSDAENKTINQYDRNAYYIIAQWIVESGLKNPNSADFPSIVTRPAEIAMSKNENIVAVQSYVDAQNSFGATVRSKWLVEFRVIDLDTYSYEPIYVNINGEVLHGEYVDLN